MKNEVLQRLEQTPQRAYLSEMRIWSAKGFFSSQRMGRHHIILDRTRSVPCTKKMEKTEEFKEWTPSQKYFK